jgi:hypothetical protein
MDDATGVRRGAFVRASFHIFCSILGPSMFPETKERAPVTYCIENEAQLCTVYMQEIRSNVFLWWKKAHLHLSWYRMKKKRTKPRRIAINHLEIKHRTVH